MPFIHTNGIRLFYEERGAGPPLLLIIGITATGAVWEKHAACWQQRFRCLMPDNRGVGLSDIPPGPYTAAQMADDYAGLLQALGIEKTRVVGCSMGSIIAQQLALRHPQKVASLVLMCPWARCDARTIAIFQNLMQCKRRLAPEAFALHVQLLIFSKKYWDDPENVAALEEARALAATAPNPQPAQGLEAQAAACMAHNVVAALHQVKQPALVIGGAADIFTPPWMAQELAAGLPHATLHLYPDCGHAFHWEALDDFNSRVQDWLLAH